MHKIFFIIIASLFLTACGGSGTSSNSNTETANTIKDVIISSVGSTNTLTETDLFNLKIIGTSNTINIKSSNNINTLDVTGISNVINVEKSTSIKTINLTGVSNTIYINKASNYLINNTGSGNKIIEQ